MENTKRLNGIDVMKLFMAFIVIFIHTSLASKINGKCVHSCLVIIQKAAVPFFFICNGYFAGVSKRNNYKTYVLRFAKMYVIWSIIYLPLDLIRGEYSLLSYCRDFFLKGYHNYSWHLWYLLGLVYGFTLLLLCKKLKISNRAVHLIVGIMYILGRMLTYCALSYSGNNIYIIQIGAIVHAYFYSGRLLCVPLYLIVGNVIAEKDCERKEVSKLTWITLIIAILILDAFYIENEISYAIMPVLFFKIAKRIRLPQCVIYKYLGRLSYWIYLWHMYIVFVSVEILKLSLMGEQYFVPLVSVLLAIIIIILENRRIRNKEF